MATIIADVQARISTQRLVDLTNPDSTGQSVVVDTTILTNAATDTEADFQRYAGIAYDSTNSRHVSLIVRGVILKLEEWVGNTKIDMEAWRKEVRHLRYVSPKSSSQMTPAKEKIGAETVRPKIDQNETFERISPDRPKV